MLIRWALSLFALLALACGPFAMANAQPVQSMKMMDCGGMPMEHSGKSMALDHCISGCLIVIPEGVVIAPRLEFAAQSFCQPARGLPLIAAEVSTPPPK